MCMQNIESVFRNYDVSTAILVFQNNYPGNWTLDFCRNVFFCYNKFVHIEKNLFNQKFLIYVDWSEAIDKKRMNWYFGLNFIDVKDEKVQNIFEIGSVTLAGNEESE